MAPEVNALMIENALESRLRAGMDHDLATVMILTQLNPIIKIK